MIYKVLAIHDKAAECFGRPVFAVAIGAAVRSFQDEVNRDDPQNAMHGHAKDFDLYELGEYDDSTGRFSCLEIPKRVASGAQMEFKLDS